MSLKRESTDAQGVENKPTWLYGILGVQALGWQAQLLFAGMFFWAALKGPSVEWSQALLTGTNLLITICIIATFAIGMIRPLRHTALRRLAIVQHTGGCFVTFAFVVTGFAGTHATTASADWLDAMPVILGLLIAQSIPVALVYASRRAQGRWLTALSVLGCVGLLCGGFLFLVLTLATSGVTA